MSEDLGFKSDKEVFDFEVEGFSLLKNIHNGIKTKNMDSKWAQDVFDKWIGSERVKFYWYDKYTKCHKELTRAYILLLIILIPFALLFLSILLYGTEVKVGDVCLSCWGK